MAVSLIQTGIELNDQFTSVIYGIINSVNLAVSSMTDMQQSMNADIDTSSLEGARDEINQATAAMNELNAVMHNQTTPDVAPPLMPMVDRGNQEPISVPVEPILPTPLVENPEPIRPEIQPNAPPEPVVIPVQWESYEGLDVFAGTGIERFEQEIASVNTMLEQLSSTQDRITQQANESQILSPQAIYDIQNVENRVQSLRGMIEQVENNPLNIGTDSANSQLERLRGQLDYTLQLQDNLNTAMQGMNIGNINAAYLQLSETVSDTERLVRDSFSNIPPVEIPIQWQTDNLDVFTGTGIDRFRQEVQSANTMLDQLNSTQLQIQQTASTMDILPDSAIRDINGMGQRLQAIQQRILDIENNPVNMGTDTANAELERLRSQLNQAVQEQNNLNDAMQNMDVSAANDAYMRLQQTVSNTERYIRDNVDEQGRFNNVVRDGTTATHGLENAVRGVVAAIGGLAIIRKIFSFATQSMGLFDTQLQGETQLLTTLSNTLDGTSITIDVDANTSPLEVAFDQIKDKASEIQSKGIYGDEIMIGGAGELSTYISDVNAVTSMMDTLSNYAAGMSGGAELNYQQMVDYATQLGKALNGSYDGLTKKGFELTKAQQKIIETGTDMEKALVLDDVISESWANLYDTMSDTPQSQIIQLKNSWGDLGEVIGSRIYPAVLQFVNVITSNWGTIESLTFNLSNAISIIATVLSAAMDAALNFAQVIMDNWSWISPIIYGVIAALGAYLLVSAIVATVTGAMALAKSVHAAATMMATGATFAETAAQHGLNAALLACPITWIILAIIALIAVIFAVCNAIAKMTGIANTGFGVITGGVFVVGAFFKNLALLVADVALGIGAAIGALCENLMTAFDNAISNVQSWWYGLLATACEVVAGICEELNKLPFVEFDYSGITSAEADYAAKAAAAAGQKGEYTDVGAAFQKGFSTFEAFGDGWASDAFEAGAAWGDGKMDQLNSFLDGLTPDAYSAGMSDALNRTGAGGNLNDIAGNTGAIKDSLEITEEDLKYLRDIAEQETVNRYTVAEVYIDQSGMQNTIKNGDDLDGFMSGLTDSVNEAVDSITEGVHV